MEPSTNAIDYLTVELAREAALVTGLQIAITFLICLVVVLAIALARVAASREEWYMLCIQARNLNQRMLVVLESAGLNENFKLLKSEPPHGAHWNARKTLLQCDRCAREWGLYDSCMEGTCLKGESQHE